MLYVCLPVSLPVKGCHCEAKDNRWNEPECTVSYLGICHFSFPPRLKNRRLIRRKMNKPRRLLRFIRSEWYPYTFFFVFFCFFCCSDQRLQGTRREYQQARAAPGYEELEAARRRVLEHDPHRVSGNTCGLEMRFPNPSGKEPKKCLESKNPLENKVGNSGFLTASW